MTTTKRQWLENKEIVSTRQRHTSALFYHWFRRILLVSELRAVPQPNVLSSLLPRRKMEEVEAVELENLVTCLFLLCVTIRNTTEDNVKVNDYTHFYCQGRAPDQTRICPLWTNDIERQDDQTVKCSLSSILYCL